MFGTSVAVLLGLLGLLLPIGFAEASPVYNGGPVLTGSPDVYYIWYGNWGTNTATTILPSFVENLSGSTYFNIATSYSVDSNSIGNTVNYGGSYFIGSNNALYEGSSLNGTPGAAGSGTIASIVSGALAANPGWASDPNGIFDVLTATDITVSGFNSGTIKYCGWHYSTRWGQSSLGVQYGFIGDPAQGGGCNSGYQDAPSINGNFGADAMTSVIAHELFETVTDPTGQAWWDSNPSSGTYGNESADMCAWQFGALSQTSPGTYYNVTLNGSKYLLQEQWLNQGGGSGGNGGACATSLALAQPTPEPRSFALLLPAMIGLAAVRWRRAAPAMVVSGV